MVLQCLWTERTASINTSCGGYVFAADIQAAELEAMKNRKTDCDILREVERAKERWLNAGDFGELVWRREVVADEESKEGGGGTKRDTRRKHSLKGTVEEITNDTDDKTEGEDEIVRLLAERAKANQESEETARREAEENLASERAGDLYNEDMLPDEDRDMVDDLEEELIVPEGWSEDAIAPNVVAVDERGEGNYERFGGSRAKRHDGKAKEDSRGEEEIGRRRHCNRSRYEETERQGRYLQP